MISLNNKKGFSLIEVLTVISVVTIGLLGLISLVIQNIQVQNVNKNFLVASMLSQEGLELVRNIRDKNWIDFPEENWDNGLLGNGSYIIEDNSGVISIDDTADSFDHDDTKLYVNGGFYSHIDTSVETPFRRLIFVTEDPVGNNYIIASSSVQWEEKGRILNYTAETYLYNWR